MYYSGLELDRASASRTDPAWVAGMLARPDATVLPLWRSQCMLAGGKPVSLPPTALPAAAPDGMPGPVFLGLLDARPVFAADLSALDQPDAMALAGAETAADLRSLVGQVSQAEAGLLGYARGLLHWHQSQRFCGNCGGPASVREGGHARHCARCDRLMFPRIEPAIIVLVELPGEPRRCLLGRHQGAAADRFSTLAGFVEIGESLEDAVRREVAEEAGVQVGAVAYQASQAWPFPAGLMIGFRATAVSEHIGVDGAELLEARWFTASQLRARMAAATTPYRLDSIGRQLIEDWLALVG
jgi:NAD+ diphosphatase